MEEQEAQHDSELKEANDKLQEQLQEKQQTIDRIMQEIEGHVT